MENILAFKVLLRQSKKTHLRPSLVKQPSESTQTKQTTAQQHSGAFYHLQHQSSITANEHNLNIMQEVMYIWFNHTLNCFHYDSDGLCRSHSPDTSLLLFHEAGTQLDRPAAYSFQTQTPTVLCTWFKPLQIIALHFSNRRFEKRGWGFQQHRAFLRGNETNVTQIALQKPCRQERSVDVHEILMG